MGRARQDDASNPTPTLSLSLTLTLTLNQSLTPTPTPTPPLPLPLPLTGKTMLYIPMEPIGQPDVAAKQKDLVQRLESTLIHWTRQVLPLPLPLTPTLP